MQLLVLLGGVVRVGDAAVDERRRAPRSGGTRRSRRRSAAGSIRYISLLGAAKAHAQAVATFRRWREAWQARRRSSRPCSADFLGDQLAPQCRAVFIFQRLRIARHQRPAAIAASACRVGRKAEEAGDAAELARPCRQASRRSRPRRSWRSGIALGRGFQRRHLARPGDRRALGVVARCRASRCRALPAAAAR